MTDCFVERCMAEYEDEFYPLDIWSGKDKLNTNSGILYLNMMAVNWAGDGPVKEEDFRKFTVESFFLVTSLVAVKSYQKSVFRLSVSLISLFYPSKIIYS